MKDKIGRLKLYLPTSTYQFELTKEQSTKIKVQ